MYLPQERCGRYLDVLSEGMSLELRSTRPSAAAKGRSGGATLSSGAAAGNATDGEGNGEGDDGDGEAAETKKKGRGAKGAAKGRASSRAKSGAATVAAAVAADGEPADASGGEIEEIYKLVRVQSADDELRERSLNQLSGGERRRVALALSLGYAELAASRGRLSSNLIVLDEILQQLDAAGCERVAQVLGSLPHESVLVVGQAHSFVTEAFDRTDVVVKRGGRSFVETTV